jgi:pre-mRNA-splicing factor CDC5/CEF1
VHASLATPNRVLATPYRGANTGATPGRGQAPVGDGATPLRDSLRINEDSDSALLTPRTRQEKERQALLRASLREGLASLPAPRADYDIVAPELEEDKEDDGMSGFVEDAAEVDARRDAQRKADEAAELRRRSQVIQRNLPLPRSINVDVLRKQAPTDPSHVADELIKAEMLAMLKFDKGLTSKYQRFEDEDIAAAKALLDEEVAEIVRVAGEPKISDAHWKAAEDDIIYLPSKARYARLSMQSKPVSLRSAN